MTHQTDDTMDDTTDVRRHLQRLQRPDRRDQRQPGVALRHAEVVAHAELRMEALQGMTQGMTQEMTRRDERNERKITVHRMYSICMMLTSFLFVTSLRVCVCV